MKGDVTRLAFGVAVAVIALAASGEPSARRQQPEFSSRTDVVLLDVAVVDAGGEPIADLSAEDFDVLDNGRQQRIQLVSDEESHLDVVLVLDVSRSVQGLRLDQLRLAGLHVLTLLESRDRAAVITFADQLNVPADLTGDRTRLIADVFKSARGPGTSLIDAVYAALAVSESEEERRSLVFVFSDGADTASVLRSEVVLQAAQRARAVVHAVAPEDARRGFLNAIVSASGGQFYSVDGLGELKSMLENLLVRSRQRYLISYSPTPFLEPGWHDVKVRVRRPGSDVNVRPGYLVEAQGSHEGQ